MGNNDPNTESVLTLPRRGPLTLAIEEHRDRNTAPDSRRGSGFQLRVLRTDAGKKAAPHSALKTRGEIEAAVCDGIRQFEWQCVGRGPQEVRANLIGDLLVLRLFGVLTLAERQLINSLDREKGRDLVKQVRTQLIESARKGLDGLIQEVTGVQLISLHHDLSTTTDEECFVFTLVQAPLYRETLKKMD